jgi:hypothetical protein
MSRISLSITSVWALLLVLAAPVAFAQEEPAAAAAAESTGESPAEEKGALGMTEGQRSRAMEPPYGKLWPFFEVDLYNREELGEEAGYEGVIDSIDVDLLMPIFGYRNQHRVAKDGWPAGEYGFSYAFPLWWSRWRPDRTDALLMPLAWHSRWEGGSRTVVPPALMTWGNTGDAWDISILWPLMSYEQNGDAWRGRVAPLAWGGGDAKSAYAAIVPLMWYERTPESTTLVTPLGGHYSDAQKSYTMATPLYHRWHEKGHDGQPVRGGQVGLPAFGSWYEQGRSGWFALPGVLSLHDDEQGDFFLAGPAWGKQSPNGKRGGWGVAPLLWRFYDEEADTESAALLPLGWYERSNEKWGFVAPLLLTFGSGNGRQSDLIQMPFYWQFNRGDTTTAVAPFTLVHSEGERGTWSSFFPLTYGAWDKDAWAFRFLWEGFAMDGDADEFHLRVLGGFFDMRLVQDEVMFELNPFFRYESKGDRYAYFSMFLGLYAYEREGQTQTNSLFWGGVRW